MPHFLETNDFLSRSNVLRRHGLQRQFFDPTNESHVAALKHYLETGNFIMHFYPEDPYSDVPMTILRKYVGHALSVAVTTTEKIEAGLVVPHVIKLAGIEAIEAREEAASA